MPKPPFPLRLNGGPGSVLVARQERRRELRIGAFVLAAFLTAAALATLAARATITIATVATTIALPYPATATPPAATITPFAAIPARFTLLLPRAGARQFLAPPLLDQNARAPRGDKVCLN